ncbi:MAG: hypothetical protein QM784_01035 [Polyangiaceae bacterium]
MHRFESERLTLEHFATALDAFDDTLFVSSLMNGVEREAFDE